MRRSVKALALLRNCRFQEKLADVSGIGHFVSTVRRQSKLYSYQHATKLVKIADAHYWPKGQSWNSHDEGTRMIFRLMNVSLTDSLGHHANQAAGF
jgi:hypothetical protein